jgi:hypothetical protein
MNGSGKTGILYEKRMRLHHYLTLCPKIISKYMKGLCIR